MKPSPLCRCVAASGLIGTCRPMKSGASLPVDPVKRKGGAGALAPGTRGHDRVDQAAGRVEVEQGEHGGVGFVDDDGGVSREPARPRPRQRRPATTLTPHPGADQIERTVGLSGTDRGGNEDRDRARPRRRAGHRPGDERQLGCRAVSRPG